MIKRKETHPGRVVPTSYEEYVKEVFDPRGHEPEVRSAHDLLTEFIDGMSRGKLPQVTLSRVREAAWLLAPFAGYPDGAWRMDMFLDSSLASSSYRDVARVLPPFIDEMNALIQARITKLSDCESQSERRGPTLLSDDNLPF